MMKKIVQKSSILLAAMMILHGASFCGRQFDAEVSGNWNMIVATNLDQAGDTHHAEEYLKNALNESDAKLEAQEYLKNIEERKAKAADCIVEAQYSIDTSYLTRYHFRDYYQMGFCHELTGNPEKAMESYNTSLKLNAKHHHAYVSRALLYEKMGNLNQAEEDLFKAVSSESGNLSSRFHLGMFYIRHKRGKDAVEEQAKILEETRPIYARILREELKRKHVSE